MEGWVPAKRISLFNKKSSKRPREPDIGFSEKVVDSFFVKIIQKPQSEPTLVEKDHAELTKVTFTICSSLID